VKLKTHLLVLILLLLLSTRQSFVITFCHAFSFFCNAGSTSYLYFLEGNLPSNAEVANSNTDDSSFHLLLNLHISLEQGVTPTQHLLFDLTHTHYSKLPIATGFTDPQL
jgi:hypothetical protein